MLEIKEKFVERVEQSIVLLKNNLIEMTLPIIICNVLFLVIIPTIIFQILPIAELFSGDISQKIGIYISFGFAVGGLYLLTYLLLLIPIQIGIIKSIKDCIYEQEIDMKGNLQYGFKSLGLVFKTYWYIFIYVYLIPASLFIIGGIIFIISNFTGAELGGIGSILGGILMGISFITFIVFAIYRGLKSTFGIISAVDTQEYTKDNLQKSLALSTGKWWRVFWNIFGIGFIVGAVIQLVNFIGSFLLIFTQDWSDILLTLEDENIDIQETIQELTQFNALGFINSIIQTGFGSALGILIVIFTYLLFKRLEDESKKFLHIEKHRGDEL